MKKILFFVLLISLNFAESPFLLLTIPKSGSYLILKVLEGVSPHALSKKIHDQYKEDPLSLKECDLAPYFANQECEAGHFNCGDVYTRFLEQAPEYKVVVNLRDLRDCYASLVYYQFALLSNVLGEDASFSDRLTHLLSMKDNEPYIIDGIYNLARMAKEAVEWIERPGIIVTRFEDLVGEKGGGADAKQKKAIAHCAQLLGYHCEDKEIELVQGALFGGSRTFRKGQIGSWKEVFTHEHLELFDRNVGRYSFALGYPYTFQ